MQQTINNLIFMIGLFNSLYKKLLLENLRPLRRIYNPPKKRTFKRIANPYRLLRKICNPPQQEANSNFLILLIYSELSFMGRE